MMRVQRLHTGPGSTPGSFFSWLGHLIFVMALFLAFLGTATVAIYTSNWPELLRRLVVIELRAQLNNRPVEIERLSFGAGGVVTISGLVVHAGVHNSARLCAVDRLAINMDWPTLFAAPDHAARAIRRVTLERPYLALARNARGVWNIDDLLTSNGSSSKTEFNAPVTIIDGEALLDDAHGFTPEVPAFSEHLRHINASVLPSDDGYMPFHLTASSTSGQLRDIDLTGGVCGNREQIQCDVRFTQVDLHFIQRFLPREVPIQLAGGRADGRWELHIGPNPLRHRKAFFYLTVTANLTDARGKFTFLEKPLPFHFAKAQLRLSDDVIELTGVRGEVGGVAVSADGLIGDYSDRISDPVLAIRLHADHADAARVVSLIPGLAELPFTFSGAMDATAQLVGETSKLRVVASLHGPTVTSEFGTFTNVRTNLAWTDGAVSLTNLSGQGYRGAFDGNAWVTYAKAGANAIFQGTAHQVYVEDVLAPYLKDDQNPSTFPPTVPSLQDIRGPVSGPFTVTLSPKDRVTLAAHCTGHVQVGKFTDGDIDASLRVISENKKNRSELERATIVTPAGQFQLHGVVTTENAVQFDISGSQIDIAALSAMVGRQAQIKPVDIAGVGYVTGVIGGSLEAPTFTGTLRALDGRYATYPFSNLSAQLTAKFVPKVAIAINNVHLTAGGAQLRGAATMTQYGRANNWVLAGHLALPLTSVRALRESLGIDLPLDGFIEGDLTLDPSDPLHAEGQGKVVIHRPVVQMGAIPLALDSASSDFTLRGQSLTITQAVAVYHGVPFTISGAVSLDPQTPPSQQLALKISADNLDLDNLTTLADRQGMSPLLTPEGYARMPLDVSGSFTLDAAISAQLLPATGAGETPAQTVQRTLVASATLTSNHNLTVVGIPYDRLTIDANYSGAAQTLTIPTFLLRRSGKTSSYQVALTAPGLLNFANGSIALPILLSAVPDGDEQAPGDANLDLLRRDLVDMAMKTNETSVLAPVFRAVLAIPAPFEGSGLVRVTLSDHLTRPRVTTQLDISHLVVGNRAMPKIDGAIAYDTATNTLTFTNLIARGGPDPDAEATLQGAITLPAYDANGREITTGTLALDLDAQKLNPGLLGAWFPNTWVNKLGGEATITAHINGAMDNPHMLASLDVVKPSVQGRVFDGLSAIFVLEDNKIFIGRRNLDADGAATLRFVTTKNTPSEPLECWGYLPFAWKGVLQPTIPEDQPMAFHIELPKQGLDTVRLLLKGLPPGEGTVEGALDISGTPGEPLFEHGTLRAYAPQLKLEVQDPDLPNRLNDVVVDLGFRSEARGDTRLNVLEVHDLSATYAREDPPKPTTSYGKTSLNSVLARLKDSHPLRWLGRTLGTSTAKIPPVPPSGALVAQGSIKLAVNERLAVNYKNIVNELQYDLFAKAIRAPIRYGTSFNGLLSGYLHLGNTDIDGVSRPLLSGVVYAEKSVITVTGTETEQPPYVLPFNPVLSLALQSGDGNMFVLNTTPMHAEIPFQPSMAAPLAQPATIGIRTSVEESLLSPITGDDLIFLTQARGKKPFLDRENFAFTYNANTLQADFITGTHGWVTGTLDKPVVDADYSVVPRKARIRLPGGPLTVQTATGHVHMPVNLPLAQPELPLSPDDQLTVTAKASATGTIDQYVISATIDDYLLPMPNGKLNIKFNQVSKPPGAHDMDPNEIYSQITGFNDVVAALQHKDQLWPRVVNYGAKAYFNEWLQNLLKNVWVDVFALNLDPTKPPDLTVTSQEFGQSNLGAFRLGFHLEQPIAPTDPTPYRFWLDYRLPDYRFLKNLSVTADIDEKHDIGINLQYNLDY